MADPKATDEPEMTPVPDISVLREDQKWSLFLWCGGTYLDRIDDQGVDTVDFLQILQWVNRIYKDVEKVHGPIVFTVKYANPIAWRTHIPLNNYWDVLDMFLAHRWRKHICIHATFDTSYPIQYYDPKKLFKPLLLTYPGHTDSDTPSTSTPPPPTQVTESPPPPTQVAETPPPPTQVAGTPPPPTQVAGTPPPPTQVAETTPPPTEVAQSTPPVPSTSRTPPQLSKTQHNKWTDMKRLARAARKSPITPTPYRLIDESSSESDSPSDSSDEDGVPPPPAVEPDEETIRRREAEEREYFDDADEVVGLSEEDMEWDGEEDETDGESGEEGDLVDEDVQPDCDELSENNSEDNLGEPVSESELEGNPKLYKAFTGSAPRRDLEGKVVLGVHQIYRDRKHLRKTLRDYAVENGFSYTRKKNEPARITWVCSAEGCPWRIHASVLKDKITFNIKTLNDHHECSRLDTNKEANSTWIAQDLLDFFKKEPNLSLKGVEKELKAKYGLEVDCQKQLWRAKVKAIDEIEGSHREAYNLLSSYRDELMRTNPGSTFKVDYDPESVGVPKFQRCFMSLAGMTDGFKNGCRPLIGLDGCHLKGPFKGTLLSAVGLDGNNGVYPIAWAVVESENTQTWTFFMELLHDILDGNWVSTKWVFMMDGQMGLPEVVEKYFPGSEQRRCAWHLFNNFRSKFSGVLLAKYFWKASRAYNETDYLDAMKVIRENNLDAYIWLLKLNPKFWSRHAFGKDSKSDHVTNNHTESFNGRLGELREKNIVKLNDGIRHKLMVRIHKRFVLSEKWDGVFTKNIAKKLKKNVEEGRKCVIAAASRLEFEVLDMYKRSWVVKLDKKYCSCGSWALTGLPCRHAVTCITHARKPIMDFVDSCYTKATFQKANGEYIIHPIEDPAFWGPGTGRTPAPPELKRGRGRPQNIRRRDRNLEPNPTPQRTSGVVQSSKCKGFGHNARTCGRVNPERMTPEERQVFESTRPAASRPAATRPPATAQPRKRTKKNDGSSKTQAQTQIQQVRRSKRNAGRADGSCSQP